MSAMPDSWCKVRQVLIGAGPPGQLQIFWESCSLCARQCQSSPAGVVRIGAIYQTGSHSHSPHDSVFQSRSDLLQAWSGLWR